MVKEEEEKLGPSNPFIEETNIKVRIFIRLSLLVNKSANRKWETEKKMGGYFVSFNLIYETRWFVTMKTNRNKILKA